MAALLFDKLGLESLLLLVVLVHIARLAHLARVILAVHVWAVAYGHCGPAFCVVAVVAHSLREMLLIRVRAIRYHCRGPSTLQVLFQLFRPRNQLC